MNKDLTVGKPQTVLWKFCMPLFGSIIFQQLYNIADSLVAGKFIGENALAAVGNSYEITLIFIAFAFGCNMGCSVVVSRLFGARKYKEMKEERQKSRIQELLFRDKRYGYKYSTMTLKYENGNVESEGIDTDGYLRAFFSGISLRQSCMDCKFRKRYRVSDFTIWDCFDVDRYSSDMNNDKGATKVIAHTDKAREIMKGIYHDVNYISSDVEKMLTLGGG